MGVLVRQVNLHQVAKVKREIKANHHKVKNQEVVQWDNAASVVKWVKLVKKAPQEKEHPRTMLIF